MLGVRSGKITKFRSAYVGPEKAATFSGQPGWLFQSLLTRKSAAAGAGHGCAATSGFDGPM
jgi:hypothetical protein